MSLIEYGESSNITSIDQCFELEDSFDQALCESQRLNITDPPSIYDFENYTSVYTNLFCILLNATLGDRQKLPETAYYCTVPLRGYDAFLFVSLALIATCFLFGKLSTVYILITGAIVGIVNYYANLGTIGNAVALWLNIKPAELFFYAFLPPLLVEQAIRIDFYLFKKTFFMSILLAVVMVILTTIILTPLILFVLGFNNLGWNWVYGALFSAIIAPTDALAVSAILKKANGPVLLTSLLEGESLLNDATGITLFQVFFDILRESAGEPIPTVWSVIPTIIVDIIRLSSIGFGIGMGFSMISYYVLKWLRWRGAGSHIESTYILAMAYLVYYITNAPANGSGVIAVVTFGIFGNATFLWGMTGSAFKSGDFEAVWDMISFAANGLVFFWAGVASMTFLIQASTTITKPAIVYVSIFLIYLFMLIIRTGCIALFNPIFRLVHKTLSVAEIAFIGWSGLRGAVSLILLSSLSFVPAFLGGLDLDESAVDARSDITLWTSFFIIFTLIINGPLIAPLLKSFGLTKTSDAARRIQEKAKIKILDFTDCCIKKYKDDDSGVFLLGADWYTVAKYVDLSSDLKNFGSSKGSHSQSIRDDKLANFDEDSFFSVSKAFLITLWQKVWSGLLKVMNVKWSCCQGSYRKNNSINDSSSSGEKDLSMDGEQKDYESEESGNFINECHFQSIDRTLSRIEVLSEGDSAEESIDIEQGLRRSFQNGRTDIKESSVKSQGEHSQDITQDCLTGKAGQKLLEELQTALSAGEYQEDSDARGDLYYSSLPAETGYKLQDKLQDNIQLQRGMTSPFQEKVGTVSRNISTDSHPTFKDLTKFFPDDSGSTRDQDHIEPVQQKQNAACTVNATTGEYLRHELMKLKSNPHLPVMEGRRRDLFGKRQKSLYQADSDKEIDSNDTLVSGYLAKNSNLKMLQREAFLLQSNSAHDKGIESGNNDSCEERQTMPETRVDANLKEIRSRLISGLKRRFTNRRAEGKISLESFQILDQACREEMSANGKLQLWSNLMSKSKGGFITQGISMLGFKITQRYKRSPRWAKWLLYYPHSWTSRIIRECLGSALLVSCEVAIEYTMALAMSQHVRRDYFIQCFGSTTTMLNRYNCVSISLLQVKWLKLHDEYFSMLLDEVQEEADKSYDFVIDREIEAPDTFRAIQSYRAAVIVLKDMQGYVGNLLEVGVIEDVESEIVLDYINEKLRKLELTGPVWRPPKLKEIMKSIKPFSELKSQTGTWIWDSGLVQEYKPGQVIFKDNPDDGAKYGIFHILNGAANKQVWSKDGDSIFEEYCGYGSCFGVGRALSMDAVQGTEIITATGNALGRGPTVFHITQGDVEKILLLALSGSDEMIDLVTGWTRLAALNILDNGLDEMASFIETCLNKSIHQSQSRDKDFGHLPVVTEEINTTSRKGTLPPSLDAFLSTDDFELKLNTDEATRRKLIEQRAKNTSREISARIRKTIFTSEVKHVNHDEVICQTSSIILLSGAIENTIKSAKCPKRRIRAPAVLPHLESEELDMINNISKTDLLDIFWKVTSDTATILVCQKISSNTNEL